MPEGDTTVELYNLQLRLDELQKAVELREKLRRRLWYHVSHNIKA